MRGRLVCVKIAIVLLAVATTVGAQQPNVAPHPEVIYFHGNILTGTQLGSGVRTNVPLREDPVPGRVTAMAVRDGRVVEVGSDEELLARKGPQTKLVDLHGAFAMPGFNDAHTHMAEAGRQKLSLDLDNVPSLEAMVEKVRAYAAAQPNGAWVLGGGWDHTKWPSKTLPMRQDLDRVTGGHPAFLERTDGHIAVVNTAALETAGITDATPDPQGGKIDRDAAGHATGIVREGPAMSLVTAHIPPPSEAVRRKGLEIAIEDALAQGVTSVQDFSDWEDFVVLQQMEREGKLPLRFAEWIGFNVSVPELLSRIGTQNPRDELLHLTQLKGFMDGSLGSRTAAMGAAYSDDPGNMGIQRYEQKKLNEMTVKRGLAGFQLGFHAIGDLANDMALDAFAAADEADRARHRKEVDKCFAEHPEMRRIADSCGSFPMMPLSMRQRFRVEHAQVVSPGAFERFRQLGVIASMQPVHLMTDMAWAEQRIGPERAKRAYAWLSFLDHGVRLAFGTDYPVESINPMRGVYEAITRQNEAGTQTFEPQEKITLDEALFAYTQGSAYGEFREKVKGRLEPGFLADFVVFDRDLTKVGPQEILHAKVLRTVVGGVTRFETK